MAPDVAENGTANPAPAAFVHQVVVAASEWVSASRSPRPDSPLSGPSPLWIRDRSPRQAAIAPADEPRTTGEVTTHLRQHFRSARPAAPMSGPAPLVSTRGLLPSAATRAASKSAAPSVRRIDDKWRIYHPPLGALPGWDAATDCTATLEDDLIHVQPATVHRGAVGRFDGARLRLPSALLKAIGVAPGVDVALLIDVDTATVSIVAGNALSDAFWAIGELEQLRRDLSQVTAERDAAVAEGERAKARAEALTEILTATHTGNSAFAVGTAARSGDRLGV